MTSFNKIRKGIVLLALLQSCNTSSVKQQQLVKNRDSLFFEVNEQIVQNEDSTSFMKIISNIPKIILPFDLYCGIESDKLPISYLKAKDFGEEISRTIPDPEISIIAGRLPIDNDKIYIMYGLIGDIIYPHLNVYDRNGNRIDSLYLHISYCLGDCDVIMSNATTINKDFSIHMVDTTKLLHCIENDNGYERILDSIIVKTRKMNLMKNGFYKDIEQNQKRVK